MVPLCIPAAKLSVPFSPEVAAGAVVGALVGAAAAVAGAVGAAGAVVAAGAAGGFGAAVGGGAAVCGGVVGPHAAAKDAADSITKRRRLTRASIRVLSGARK